MKEVEVSAGTTRAALRGTLTRTSPAGISAVAKRPRWPSEVLRMRSLGKVMFTWVHHSRKACSEEERGASSISVGECGDSLLLLLVVVGKPFVLSWSE